MIIMHFRYNKKVKEFVSYHDDLKTLNLMNKIAFNRTEWKRKIHVADPVNWD